jgi:predicted acetyltransferase
MNRADIASVVSHGKLATSTVARAKRNPTLAEDGQISRTSTGKRNGGSGGSRRLAISMQPPRVAPRESSDRRKSPVAENGSAIAPLRPARRTPRLSDAARFDARKSNGTPEGALLTPHLKLRLPPAREEVLPARVGDQPEIYHALLAIFQGPSREEYQAEHDEPGYDPSRRLVVKRDGRIVSHVHLSTRQMLFGSAKIPAAVVGWLGTLPEFRGQGYATRLLHQADDEMRRGGAVLGVLQTRAPHFFRRAGWAVCGRHSRSEASAREVLARLSADRETPRMPLSLRLWRHVELPSLQRIYSQNTERAFGPLARTEEYWRWMISRKAFDHIVVAIHGRDRMELVDTNAPLVGYAVVRQERVVELLASPDYPSTGMQLLARACGDLLERNRQRIVLEAPPEEPLHNLMVQAGGTFNRGESDGGEVLMVRVVNPAALVRALEAELVERARAAELPAPVELGFSVGGQKHVLTVTRRTARLSRGRLGRSYLTLKENEFTRLLLGHGDVAETAAGERIVPSTQTAIEIARILFPRQPLWRPSWDDLPA